MSELSLIQANKVRIELDHADAVEGFEIIDSNGIVIMKITADRQLICNESMSITTTAGLIALNPTTITTSSKDIKFVSGYGMVFNNAKITNLLSTNAEGFKLTGYSLYGDTPYAQLSQIGTFSLNTTNTLSLLQLNNPSNIGSSATGSYLPMLTTSGSDIVSRLAASSLDLRTVFTGGDKIDIQGEPSDYFIESVNETNIVIDTNCTNTTSASGAVTKFSTDSDNPTYGNVFNIKRNGFLKLCQATETDKTAKERLDVSETTKTQGRRKELSTKINDYIVTKSDERILLNGLSNTVTITLPTIDSSNHGQVYWFKAKDITNTLTINTDGTDLIDETGINNFVFTTLNEKIELQADNDNSEWIII